MIFKREKILIKLSAILSIIRLFFTLLSGLVLNTLRDNPQFTDIFEAYGNQIPEDIITTGFIINILLLILVIVILFIIAKKLNTQNYKTYGIVLIILGVVTFSWLLGIIANILIIIAGILILVNSKRALEETKIEEK